VRETVKRGHIPWLSTALCLAAISGCSAATPNAPGDTPAATSAGSGASAPAATSFSEIYAMLFPMPTNARCDACHALPANDVSNGNLMMGADKASAYAALVGKTSMSSRCMSRPLVVAGQPEMSLMLLKLSENPPCGSRMPLGGSVLSSEQLDKIRGWIAAGAKDD
jgi:hypothetical protein